jgi:murein DD-endopeptidase MepM/ murein hydrolase activator NlpD
MFDGGWFSLLRGRAALFMLALFGLVYLFLQMRPLQTEISGWRGSAFGNSASVGFRGDAQPIVGEAMPQTGRGQPGDDVPSGNPLKTASIVMTQGYGVGSHAPAAIWGGVDLAIDGNGDGEADPDGTWGAPIYATHSGVAHLHPDSWPGGNYLAIESEHYKTAFAHLKDYAVQDGQWVERGQVIGYIGSTGQSSGPHLHYEVWQDGANINPIDFGALDETR